MNQLILLYLLRLVGAILLLAFLAGMAWLIYQDLRYAARATRQQQSLGYLRVIASDNSSMGRDALFPLLPVTSIGRAQTNTLVIDDGFVSNHHALITLRERQWWLEDLGSRNGTLLNDLDLDEAAVVSSGDVITVGGTQLKFEPQLVIQEVN